MRYKMHSEQFEMYENANMYKPLQENTWSWVNILHG